MRNQKTLKKSLQFKGRGLHTGKKSEIILKPADANTGIVFTRNGKKVRAVFGNVSQGAFSITLKKNGMTVKTIEHLLAALYCAGIDNCICEISAEEVPFMDGSSYMFTKAIRKAGVSVLKEKRNELIVKKSIACFDKDRMIMVSPGKDLHIDYFVDYAHPVIGSQRKQIAVTEKNFIKELSRARTFGWAAQVKEQKKKGLIKGGSLRNAVLFGKDKVINKEGLRFKDEVVRHKILDLLGALALLPFRIKGNFLAFKSGHTLDIKLIKKLGGLNGKR